MMVNWTDCFKIFMILVHDQRHLQHPVGAHYDACNVCSGHLYANWVLAIQPRVDWLCMDYSYGGDSNHELPVAIILAFISSFPPAVQRAEISTSVGRRDPPMKKSLSLSAAMLAYLKHGFSYLWWYRLSKVSHLWRWIVYPSCITPELTESTVLVAISPWSRTGSASWS